MVEKKLIILSIVILSLIIIFVVYIAKNRTIETNMNEVNSLSVMGITIELPNDWRLMYDDGENVTYSDNYDDHIISFTSGIKDCDEDGTSFDTAVKSMKNDKNIKNILVYEDNVAGIPANRIDYENIGIEGKVLYESVVIFDTGNTELEINYASIEDDRKTLLNKILNSISIE